MNTKEIRRALQGIKARSVGVYAADRIPFRISFPAAIVANTDPSNLPGSHWIAIYIDKNGCGIYFDSYGLPPMSTHHIRRLKKICKRYRWNRICFQSLDSKVCGEFCIAYLYHMCEGKSLQRFCKLFTRDTFENDRLAAKFYDKIIKRIKNTKKQQYSRVNSFPLDESRGGGIGINQSCTSRHS